MAVNPQHVVLFHHFRLFLEAAAKEGIDVAPLKGAHLLTSVYPEGEDRGMLSDVDFLVTPAHFGRAVGILERMGWRRRDMGSFDESTTHEVGLVRPIDDARSILFEVHRYLIDPRRLPIDHDAIWRRSSSGEFDGAPCRRLANEDHFVFVALHSALHRLDPLTQALQDLERILHNGSVDLDLIARVAMDWHVTRIVWLFLILLDVRHPDSNIVRTARLIEPDLPVRVALGTLVPNGISTRLARLDYSLQAALLFPWLLDGPRPVLRFARYYAESKLQDIAARCRGTSG